MIEVVKVFDRFTGNSKAHDILAQTVDLQTLLALSGGTSADYRKIIVETGDILPGAICMVDERFGMPFHDDSNELLINNFGVIAFYSARDIKVHKILTGEDMQKTAQNYNLVIDELFKKFTKKVGVMGVGLNLHTAGIFPNSEGAHSPNWVVGELVEDMHPNRITLTFKALGEFGTFVILMFGGEKREAVKMLLDEDTRDMQKYPAIFYRKCKAKCYLITDQAD